MCTLIAHTQWHNRQRGRGADCPADAFHREIFADLPGKREGTKIGKMEKKRRKIVKGEVENMKRKGKKYENKLKTFFFLVFLFVCFSLLETTLICLGLQKKKKKEISAGKKHFTLGKVALPPLKNIPLMPLQIHRHLKLSHSVIL